MDQVAGYPRYLRPGFTPFDPLELAALTEKVAGSGPSRKYTDFYCVGVYGGISTAYTVGCPLRCVFCWVDFSRDFPESHGHFYTPEQAFNRLVRNARKRGLSKLRISGGEPTLGREHLLRVLDLIEGTTYLFILETNGLLLGAEPDFASQVARFSNLHLRVSLKAGTGEGFQERTGAEGRFWELPYQAVANLARAGVSFHVAAMSDPRLMPPEERAEMVRRLQEAGYHGYLEEETCDPYRTSIVRLREAGFEVF